MITKNIITHMLLPTNKFEQDWFHDYVLRKKLSFDFVKGRVDFLDDKGNPIKGNPHASVVIKFDIKEIGKMPETIDYERPKHHLIKV